MSVQIIGTNWNTIRENTFNGSKGLKLFIQLAKVKLE